MFLILVAVAFAGIAYTWWATFHQIAKGELLRRRRTTALMGITAVSVQAALFIIMWYFVARRLFYERPNPSFAGIMGGQILCFPIAISCAVTRKGLSRWCLLYSSIVLAACSFFTVVISGITF